MKRLAIVISGGVLFLMLSSQVLAASFTAVIHEDFGGRASAEPCVQVALGWACPGTGTVQGYGQVTSSVLFPYAGEPIVRTLTFKDGSTLVTNETYLSSRYPGKALDAPGALVSYGNPGFDHYAWKIVGGTGTFDGASGEGEWVNVVAGDTKVLKFSGTLLP